MPSLNRILIANRGEIAVRIARTVADLGLESVAVYAADDADSLHARSAATAVTLPGSGVAAYLDGAAIIAAARALGCDAVHPGYGFLSESPAFAAAVEAAGLIFIGPTPVQLERLGDKVAARSLAVECGVPVPDATGLLAGSAALVAFVATLAGDGAMLKAVHGGGGRGMRMAMPGDDLGATFAAAASEAAAAFGRPELFAERLIDRARHIEVQLVGDGRGAVVALGNRDCSLQLRRQKLVEFAPATGLVDGVADHLEAAAIAIGRAIGLRGVATIEFLVRADAFWFLEANPRLQVEHTVTEAVYGLDLVAAQIGIAGGGSLAELGLDPVPTPRGAAVQLRINAVTVTADGLMSPAIGEVVRLAVPGGPGIRLDSGIAAGDRVGAGYDPLIAKLIVHAGAAGAPLLARARRAAAELAIEGLATSLPLVRALLARDEVVAGTATTRFVEDHLGELLDGIGTGSTVAPSDGVIVAPISGLVVAVDVVAGEAVARGQALVTVEAMKMHHVVTAPFAGTVASVSARVGSGVEAGATLVRLDRDLGRDDEAEIAVAVDLDHVRPDLAAVRARHAFGFDANRAAAVAKRAGLGLRTARANVEDLLDPGSFDEYGALAVAAQRKRRSEDDLVRSTPGDGMVAGFGTVGGARTCVLAYDYSVLAGTQGYFNHKKTDRVLAVASDAGTPVVFFTEGGGGRPGDVDADQISVTGLDVTSFAHWAAMNGKAPRIAVNAGRCFAGNAIIFGLSDVTIATRGSNIGLGGPAMIEGGGLGRFAPEAIGPAAMLAAKGAVDLLVDDEAAGVVAAQRVLGYFGGPATGWTASDQRRLRHHIPENRLRPHDMRVLVELVADISSVLELRRDYGLEMMTAFIRIEGQPFGLIANNPWTLGGAIGSEGAEKAARFLQLCDAYGLPIVSLVDTPGFMVGPASEETAAVRRGARLVAVGANLSVPLFAVVVRKGYGLGAQAMAGGSFRQPVLTMAWPTAEFGAMGIEGAVRLGFSKELAGAEDQKGLEARLIAAMYARGAAVSVAAHLEIDAVIDPFDTRAVILRALRTAGPPPSRRRGFVDVW
ncbi:hypothetical protein KX816_12790 [Sphingosinicellaceae bacterium]|nr:hypothetical protein KX816_12790 [Sphingosinicellaceae bacterium]